MYLIIENHLKKKKIKKKLIYPFMKRNKFKDKFKSLLNFY